MKLSRSLAVTATIGSLVFAALLPATAAHAAGKQRYVSTSGTNNPTCLQTNPCSTLGQALSAANNGDTIHILAGTFTEQDVITKSVTIVGAGQNQTAIHGPSTYVFDRWGYSYILEVDGATVSLSKLTVTGPGMDTNNCAHNATSLDVGIAVLDNGTLDLSRATVENIFDADNGQMNGPGSGCQRGDAIRIGIPRGQNAAAAFVGHATITNSTIKNYQKNGVTVDGQGSTLDLEVNTISNIPEKIIASNGVEYVNGAVATIENDTVSGNECLLSLPACGFDLVAPGQNYATGIYGYAAGARSVVKFNTITKNDVGFATGPDTGTHFENNYAANNRWAGAAITLATGMRVVGNTLLNNGYGIFLYQVSNSRFAGNSAFGNSRVDLFASLGGDGDSTFNTFGNNSCSTSLPTPPQFPTVLWKCGKAPVANP